MKKSGGGLLINDSAQLGHGFSLVGLDDGLAGHPNLDRALAHTKGKKLIILFHEPQMVESLTKHPFALALAGHSHGGQVRLPVIGAPVLPQMVGRYDWGLYQTPGGSLYVTTGIGTWGLPLRLGCRPEIALFLAR